MTGRGPDVTQVWNFERQVDGAWTSLPGFFKSHGYLSLGVGKIWHWGAGPGNQWHNDIKKYFPYTGQEFQALKRAEDALLNATISPVAESVYSEAQLMDGVFANRALELIDIADSKKSVKPFFIAVGFHLPHEPYVFPAWAWDVYQG